MHNCSIKSVSWGAKICSCLRMLGLALKWLCCARWPFVLSLRREWVMRRRLNVTILSQLQHRLRWRWSPAEKSLKRESRRLSMTHRRGNLSHMPVQAPLLQYRHFRIRFRNQRHSPKSLSPLKCLSPFKSLSPLKSPLPCLRRLRLHCSISPQITGLSCAGS